MVDYSPVLFQKYDDGRAAELEFPFFLASAELDFSTVVTYPTHEQSSHLDLNDVPEVLRSEEGVLPAVALVDVVMLQRNGIDSVELPGNVPVSGSLSGVDVAIAVVVVHTEPEYQAISSAVVTGEGSILQQVSHAVVGILYRENAPGGDAVDGELAVAGADEVVGGHIHGPQLWADLPGEKLVVGAELSLPELGHINGIFADKGLYQGD